MKQSPDEAKVLARMAPGVLCRERPACSRQLTLVEV